MRPVIATSLFCLLGLIVLSTAAMADEIYLEALFNDKTIDAEIGTGGATVGEPTWVSDRIAATVRATPMATPSLEIRGLQDVDGSLEFTLLGDQELTSGMVDVSFDLWFSSLDAMSNISIYNGPSQNRRFAELGVESDGQVYLHYGQSSSAGDIGQIAIDMLYRVIFEFNMDAGTFDVWLDGTKKTGSGQNTRV